MCPIGTVIGFCHERFLSMTDLSNVSVAYYPKRHLAPVPVPGRHKWQNDGQNYVYDRKARLWRTWALGNPEWTPNSGFPTTSWISYSGPTIDTMTSDDDREPSGKDVFIDKNSSLSGTYWSGSVWVDEEDRLGRGRGSVYYYISGPAPVLQAIYLLVAKRLGEVPYNLGICCSPDLVPESVRDEGRDFRDCRVFWDDDNSQLVMATTIGTRFAFFRSVNGTSWDFLSSMEGPGPLVECPNVMKLKIVDDHGNTLGHKWAILGAVQGDYPGGTQSHECCVAWLGAWDGTQFIPDEQAKAIPLDYGPDSYATVAGRNGRSTYVGCWLGNWDYSLLPSPYKGFQNIQSYPRACWIQTDYSGQQKVYTFPVEKADGITGIGGPRQTIGGEGNPDFASDEVETSDCYRLDVVLDQVDGHWPEEVRISVNKGRVEGTEYSTDLIIYRSGQITFDRTRAGILYPGYPNEPPEDWGKTYSIPAGLKSNATSNMIITILIDTSSLEVFINGGQTSLTGLVFPPKGCTGGQHYVNAACSCVRFDK